MNDERLLQRLTPPEGGWQRLVARRDTRGNGFRLALPLAVATALSLVVVLLRPPPQELSLPWNGGRLVSQPSDGVGVQSLTNAKATALPSSDPRVLIYWVQ